MRAGRKAAGDGPLIEGMTAVQVRERAYLTPKQVIERIAEVGPRVARSRQRVPGLFRLMPMKQEVGGVEETCDAVEFCRILSGRGVVPAC